MILKKIEYSTFPDDNSKYWALKPTEIGRINLFVAKNATGKTRTLKTIDTLGVLISGSGFTSHANYSVEFSEGDAIYQYRLNIESSKVVSEELIINGLERIARDNRGIGTIYAEELGKDIKFRIPANDLAVSRRDAIQHPFLEPLFNWANGLRYYAFGSSMKQEYGTKIDEPGSLIHGNSDKAVEVFIAGKFEFDATFKEYVLSSMREIGYDLTDMDAESGLYSTLNTSLSEYTLLVNEGDRNAPVLQVDMSQGMFRALSIIIHLTYHILMKTPVTILIDDIGEGLDFDRSSRLIKLLIETAKNNDNIQLIMSTNDRFVMNAVPLEYWQVIQRKGGECWVANYQNSKDQFDEFEYTGLNNFDFFRTDFLNSGREPV
jgi:hypothetical protein